MQLLLDSSIPVIAGLAVGVILIAILSLLFSHESGFVPEKPHHVTVVIPKGSSLPMSERNNFEPEVIRVVIGTNNTVRWVNQDVTFSTIRANHDGDSAFHTATHLDESDGVSLMLSPGEAFEFTFTRPGEFGYHSEPHPHKHGTVIVLQRQGND